MNVSIGKRWQEFVDNIVQSGRYGSATEVVHEGLRLVEEREAKLRALRETLDASIAEAGSFSDDEVAKALGAKAAELVGRASKLEGLRATLIEGEQSGVSTPFDFEEFIARKRGNRARNS